MSAQTLNLLIEAGLFGFATALVFVALVLIGLAWWQVYKACFSPMAKRKRAFQKRLAKNSAHYRKILGLHNN